MSREAILLRLLQKEHCYYQAVLELTEQENQLLKSKTPSPKAVFALEKKRQILLACVEEIEDALRPVKKYWDAKTDRSDSESQSVEQELKSIHKVLQKLIDLDKENQSLMSTIMEQLRNSQPEPVT